VFGHMAGEIQHGVELYAGLHSPGPRYGLPSACFDKASKSPSTGRPTWGPAPQHSSQKIARARVDEVRFIGRHFMREMQGHYSPGPQYRVPGTTGGAPGNYFASTHNLQAVAERHGAGRRSLSAVQLGAEPLFCLTPGSFSDPKRAAVPTTPGDTAAEFWRRATTLQTSEVPSFTRDVNKQPWSEAARGPNLYGDEVQARARGGAEARHRQIGPVPYRQLGDMAADPPVANVFGNLKSHEDFGYSGGLNSGWRESKVHGNSSVGTRFGPPANKGKLRYAYIQSMGPNSVPRGASHVADVDGGRITKYTIERPATASFFFAGDKPPEVLARPNSSPRNVGSTRASSTFGNSGMAGAMGASGMSNFSAADWATRGIDESSESAAEPAIHTPIPRMMKVNQGLLSEAYPGIGALESPRL